MTTTSTAETRRIRWRLVDAVKEQADVITARTTYLIRRSLPSDAPHGHLTRRLGPLVDDALVVLRHTSTAGTELQLLPAVVTQCLEAGIPADILLESLGQFTSVLLEHLGLASSRLPPSSAVTTVAASMTRDLASIAASARIAVEERCRRETTEGRIIDFEPVSDDNDPGPPYQLLIAVPVRVAPDPVSEIRDLLERSLSVVARPVDPSTSHVALVVPAATDQRALARIARYGNALLLVHPPARTMDRLSAQYTETTSSLAGVVRLAASPGLLPPSQVAALMALQTAPLHLRVDFVRVTLGGVLALPPNRAVPLLDVLRALSTGVDKGVLAEALGLHRQGLKNRAVRFREHTGLDPRRPYDRLRLLVAYVLWKLNQPAMHPLGSREWQPERVAFRTSHGTGGKGTHTSRVGGGDSG